MLTKSLFAFATDSKMKVYLSKIMGELAIILKKIIGQGRDNFDIEKSYLLTLITEAYNRSKIGNLIRFIIQIVFYNINRFIY